MLANCWLGPARGAGDEAAAAVVGPAGGWRHPRCTVAGCEREVGVYARVVVGGEALVTAWCRAHAAEYRVDDAGAGGEVVQ